MLRDTRDIEKTQVPKTDAVNFQIREVLSRRAKERATSLRWNTYTLVMAYVILAVAIILSIRNVAVAWVGLLAAFGLGGVWLVGRLQARRLETRLMQEEVRTYAELLASANAAPAPEPTPAAAPAEQTPLTDRELEVLRQMSKGMTNKEAARALDISEQTVKNHVGHIFLKLGVNDRTSAVLMAIREGWIDDRAK